MKNHYAESMAKEGVLILKNQISENEIFSIRNEIAKIRHYVMNKISSMPRPLTNYSDIAERQLNRLDYRCGFTADIFVNVGKPIIELVASLSPLVTFTHYWGAIPSLPGSGPTDMHRDIYPIYNNLEGNNIADIDIQLPPYYFTVLMPLVEITEENGPTEFIKGSHKHKVIDNKTAEITAPLISPGDMVIFDGRTMHRGRANHASEERLIAYITFTANWYHDQTFTKNNYLFPELLMK